MPNRRLVALTEQEQGLLAAMATNRHLSEEEVLRQGLWLTATRDDLDPEWRDHLDPGIRAAVLLLNDHGIVTSESCQGGEGHAYDLPTITFGGGEHAGLRAVWLLAEADWHVRRLTRAWDLNSGSHLDPYWQVTMTAALVPVLEPAEAAEHEGQERS